MQETWLITDCSSDFGEQLATAVAQRGDELVATARRTDGLKDLAEQFPDTVQVAVLDVTWEDAAAGVIRAGEEVFGGLDVLVNNAGFVGTVEESTPAEYRPSRVHPSRWPWNSPRWA